jgi:osmotically-inducible protein OsmY
MREQQQQNRNRRSGSGGYRDPGGRQQGPDAGQQGTERASQWGNARRWDPLSESWSSREPGGTSSRDFDYERDQSYAGQPGGWGRGRGEAGIGGEGYWNSADEYDERPYAWENEPHGRSIDPGGRGYPRHDAGDSGRYRGSYGGYGGFGSSAPGPNAYRGYGESSSREARRFGSTHEGQRYDRYGQEGNYASERVEWQQQQRGRAPKGYTRSDERIREDVSDRLVEANIDASEMEVEVKGGEVELKGTAPSRDVKHRAETIAASVLGVKDVSNRLRIQRERAPIA